MEGQLSFFEEELDTKSQIVKPPTDRQTDRQTIILF